MRIKEIRHLSPERASAILKSLLNQVADSVDTLDETTVKGHLEDLVDSLDTADLDDAHGTEGWRHRYMARAEALADEIAPAGI